MTTLRRATVQDSAFIESLCPGFGRVAPGFPRDTDLGFIAVREGADAGAVWSRLFTPDDPGPAWVGDDTRQLGLGVVEGRRGEGIGRALMNGIIAATTTSLSVSVADDDPVEELFRKSGFVPVSRSGSSTVMVHSRR